MPAAPPIYSESALVKALEKDVTLGTFLESHGPDQWRAAQRWKSINGSTCGLYRAILKVLFSEALHKDPRALQDRLRSAGYHLQG